MPNLKKVLGTLILAMILSGAAKAAVNNANKENPSQATPIQTLVDKSAALEKEWGKTKEDFKAKLDAFIKVLDNETKARQETLDNGDRDVRKRLNEEINDLLREKANNEKMLAELSVVSTFNLVKLKEDMERKIDRTLAELKGR